MRAWILAMAALAAGELVSAAPAPKRIRSGSSPGHANTSAASPKLSSTNQAQTANPSDASSSDAPSPAASTGTSAQAASSAASSTASNDAVPSSHVLTVHPDGQCEEPLSDKGFLSVEAKFGFPKTANFSTKNFPGGKAKSGGGFDLFFNIPQPDPNCRILVMVPYKEGIGPSAAQPGNEIINVGNSGCYFGHVDADSEFLVSFCCGSGDCGKAGLNDAQLLAGTHNKRGIDQNATKVYPLQQASTVSLKSPPQKDRKSSERLTLELDPRDAKNTCGQGSKVVNGPYQRAGQQIIVSDFQTCSNEPCSVSTDFQIQVGTTASSSTSQSVTTSDGTSFDFQAGFNIFGASVSSGFSISHDVTTTVNQTLSQSVTNTKSTTVDNSIGFTLGAVQALAFTPSTTCNDVVMFCPDQTEPITICQPNLTPGGQVEGVFNAISTG